MSRNTFPEPQPDSDLCNKLVCSSLNQLAVSRHLGVIKKTSLVIHSMAERPLFKSNLNNENL